MNDIRFESILLRVLLVTMPAAGATGCFVGTSCGDSDPVTAVYTLDDQSGGEMDGGAPDGGVTADNCAQICAERTGGAGIMSCGPTKDESGNDAVECTFVPICEGRRPAGLVSRPSPSGPSEVGRFFARASHNEAASVDAFHILRDELQAHGAPRALVRAAARAARDEVRHARMTAALARRYGASAERPIVARRPPRDLAEIAAENAAEGCVRETYGALVAAWQARAAADPAVRAVMLRIARDEARHAALGWRVARWTEGRLEREPRGRALEAHRAAWSELVTAASREVPEALVRHAGLPRPGHALAMLDELARALPSMGAAPEHG
jgi:hypothetical protein